LPPVEPAMEDRTGNTGNPPNATERIVNDELLLR
jgi:hypothetical protein